MMSLIPPKRLEYTAALVSLLLVFAMALSGCEVVGNVLGNVIAYGFEEK